MYLAHTSHLQFLGFWIGGTGWILSVVTVGLIQWRVWYVMDSTIITSGVAWIGIWRVCFYSRLLMTSQYDTLFCKSMRMWDPFVPWDIRAAQVLTLVAVIVGVGGNAAAIYGLRNIYFGIEEKKHTVMTFAVSGIMYILAGLFSIVPLSWNIYSVMGNCTITFPINFHMPPAPIRQEVGTGVEMGIASSIMMMASGVVFLSYRFPAHLFPKNQLS